MINRRTSGALIIVLAVIVAVVLAVTLDPKNSKKTNTPKVASTGSSKTIALDKIVTITFPCTTHAVKLKPTSTDNVSGYGADCGIKVNNGSQEVVFTAAVEHYPNKSAVETAVFNYCTAKSTYPGPVSGSTIYILQPSTQVVDNTTFSICALSIDATTAYETTARAIDGNYGILLNVDASSTTTASSLFSYLQNFMGTLHVKN